MPRTPRRLVLLSHALLLSIVVASGVSGVQKLAPGPAQIQDAEFARLVREWTTKPEFLSPLVDHLPVDPAVPSPRDVLGYHVGMPGRLTYYAECLNYYRRLATATPGMLVPDSYIQRLKSVPKDKQGAEGIKIAVEQIQQCLEMKGVAGIHLMAIAWEERAEEILKVAGMLPRPKVD